MLKQSGIMVQHNPSHSASSCSNESLGVEPNPTRTGPPPLPLEPPPPNGSPTDSGYRSVPRHVNENLYANGFEMKFSRHSPKKPPSLPQLKDKHGHAEVLAPILASPGSSTRSRDKQGSDKKKVSNGSFDTINTNISLPEEFSLERCPKLVELDRIPWNEKDVVTVLQRGRTKDLVHRIAIDVVPRLTYLLQRPLIRMAREMARLSQRFGKCSQNDVQTAVKVRLKVRVSVKQKSFGTTIL